MIKVRNLRVLAIDGVAAAADILVEPQVLRHETVVHRIVDAPRESSGPVSLPSAV
jgi:hypothetical protein